MDIFDLCAAVFAGNIGTLAFLWGFNQLAKEDDPVKVEWLAYLAMLFPLGMFILVMLSNKPA